ncbi:c-type cytochrome [Ulvibacterium marinum]|uniref:c-type cytochrome n=1 Tax=Ulvibacterium marinum TaxID=2419782 RepID=UPI002494FE6A|nr:c-type cytochrome [Ulvibacterium marinum]
MKRSHFLLSMFFVCIACSCSNDNIEPFEPNPDPDNSDDPAQNPDPSPEPVIEVTAIPDQIQRNGDVNAGYEYLISGDYMSSGIPYGAFITGFGEDNANLLGRIGDNAVIPYDYTAVTAPNGVRIVGPNCMQCHAGRINGEFIIGLGIHDIDFTINRNDNITLLNSAISFLYGQASDEWAAYDQFRKSIEAIGPKTITETRGVNSADKITEVLIAHRDKNTLEWTDDPYVEVGDEVIPTDVPAWWLLKKKNAMFYHGIGRGDFCKSFIGSSLLTLADKEIAEEVDEKMPDVLAYIYSLESPTYPFAIDSNLAEDGKTIFENTCSSCHGNYGGSPTYPNYMVSLNSVGTDPELSNHYNQSSPINDYFMDWFNTGWFGTSPNPLEIFSEGGYVAPPLDGIWATAPYFHNASVPTLADVLNSESRPEYWRRSYDSSDYDEQKVGWNYETESSKIDKNTYDTTIKGYGNEGHTFGDELTDSERAALLEYLKTL